MALVKMSVDVSEETLQELREVARERHITLTQAVRDAIAVEKYVTEELQRGSRMLVLKRDRTMREVELSGWFGLPDNLQSPASTIPTRAYVSS